MANKLRPDSEMTDQERALVEASPEDKRKSVARALGFKLSAGSSESQIMGLGYTKEHEGKRTGSKQLYVVTPNVELTDGIARGTFVRADVARATAEEILRLCDANDL